jgi:hypothetical protein
MIVTKENLNPYEIVKKQIETAAAKLGLEPHIIEILKKTDASSLRIIPCQNGRWFHPSIRRIPLSA